MKNGEMDGGVFRRSFFYPAPFQKNPKFKIEIKLERKMIAQKNEKFKIDK